MERLRRIELPSGAWKALILPLNYSRITHGAHKKIRTSYLQIRSLLLYPNELHGLMMVDLTRLELVTFRLSGERSNQLSYRSMAGLAGFEPTSQRLPVSIFVFYHYYYNPVVEITRIELVSRRFHFGFTRLSNPSIPLAGAALVSSIYSMPYPLIFCPSIYYDKI